MSRGVCEGGVVNSVSSLHPDEITLVLGHKLVQQFSHCCVSTVPIIDYNAIHILRQAHWAVDLNLWE